MTQSVPLPATVSPEHLAWGAHALWEQLVVQLPDLSVEVVARLSSTNSALLERARVAGAGTGTGAAPHDEDAQRHHSSAAMGGVMVKRSTESRAFGRRSADLQPCLLVAEHQTAGRGRHGQHWHAAAGSSLTFSIALTLNPPDWAGLSLAVGVALAEALEPLDSLGTVASSPRLCIKWPNDLWLMDADTGRCGPGRKLGGVLIETVASGDKRLVVVGVGLNVLPLGLNAVQASTGAACLQELHAAMDAPAALARVASPLVSALLAFERSGFAAFADRFAARDLLFQRRITTTQVGLPEGVAQGVSAGGALQVQTASGLHAVSSGEVSVRPVVEPNTPSGAAC
jgi:BirA family transcriptional regulator, biotin operon repressor / biotin---[acetyl-CoA-carboxylase] ligase